MKITINPKFMAWTLFLVPLLYCIVEFNLKWYNSGDFKDCQTLTCFIGYFSTFILCLVLAISGGALLYAAMTGEFESTTIEVGGKKPKGEKDSLLLQQLGEAEIKGKKKEADALFKELKDKGHFN